MKTPSKAKSLSKTSRTLKNINRSVFHVFDGAYRRLNTKQKEAVDTIEGPVMVRAGPGTGKTQVLTLRIANILRKTDTAPENILALTFTESGVAAMRERLFEVLGGMAYRVKINTFHSFCNDTISRFPEEFPRIVGGRVADESERLGILEEVIAALPLAILRPWGDAEYYVAPSFSAIKDIKREGFSPEEFESLMMQERKHFDDTPEKTYESGKFKGQMKGKFATKEKRIEKNEELSRIYYAYEKRMRERRLYDYEDMILEVLRACEINPHFLLILQEESHYLLADEHQDANNAQNRLLELLASFHERPNIFVVGDEKQAIYRFQGASLRNFLSFTARYPHAKVISLEENYRSSQIILDASKSLIEKSGREVLRLIARAERRHIPLRVITAESQNQEAEFLAEDVARTLGEGAAPEDIAVIVRDNGDAPLYARALRAEGVGVSVESSRDEEGRGGIENMLFVLRSVDDPSSEEKLGIALFIDFLGLSVKDVSFALAFASRARLRILDVLSSPALLGQARAEHPEDILLFSEKFLSLSRAAKNFSLLSFFETLLHDGGILQAILSSPGGLSRLSALEPLFEAGKKFSEGKSFVRLADFLKYVDMLERYGLPLPFSKRRGETGKVRLMTAHASKGLEFDSVYIVGARDGKWGGRKGKIHFHLPLSGDSEDEEDHETDDERRLMYVAITRAKRKVSISAPAFSSEGRIFVPSLFTREIENFFLCEEKALPRSREPLCGFRAHHVPSRELDQEFLQNLFLSQGLSVTHLNNYLECPWRYFFVNLIRIPQSENKHQLFGTVMHASLREMFDRLKSGEEPTKEALLASFEVSLGKTPLSERERREAREKGRNALSGYFDAYKKEFDRYPVISEYSVKGAFIDISFEGESVPLLLSGKLDKIEVMGSGDQTSVNVVDYKTGKPKSRNDIEGKIKTSNGNYKRQLVFYKMLLERSGDMYVLKTGEIDFLEPDGKGKFHKEKFDVTGTDVEELEGEIQKMAEEVLALSFVNSHCSDKDCRYCRLGESLTARGALATEGTKIDREEGMVV